MKFYILDLENHDAVDGVTEEQLLKKGAGEWQLFI